eukprot:3517477-Rhodomonas_salina.2
MGVCCDVTSGGCGVTRRCCDVILGCCDVIRRCCDVTMGYWGVTMGCCDVTAGGEPSTTRTWKSRWTRQVRNQMRSSALLVLSVLKFCSNAFDSAGLTASQKKHLGRLTDAARLNR